MAAGDDLVVSWQVSDRRPLRATLSVGGEERASAPVPQWPPQGWIAGAPESLEGIVSEAHRNPATAPARLHADLQRMGRGLWDSLFPGAVGAALLKEIAGLGTRRLVLQTDDDYLLSLPLEAAIAADGSHPIGLDPRLDVVRRLAGPEPRGEVPAGPLRVVVAIESPDAPSGSVLDFEAEEWVLLAALDRPIGEGRAFVEFLDEGHVEAVRAAAADLKPQVLHITGHGAPGGMAFEGRDGEEVVFKAKELATELAAAESVRLIVASACLTGAERAAFILPGVARALVGEGFPAVLAMQASVRDTFATAFLGAFYEHLGRGDSPSRALAEARRHVATPGPGEDPTGEWAIPVLYEGPRPAPLYDPLQPPWLPRARMAQPRWRGVSYRPRGEFVGRRGHKRRALRTLRSRGAVGLVWHGLGGVGKSALSTHVAERLIETDGYRPVVLRGQQSPAQFLEALARDLRDWASSEDGPKHEEFLRFARLLGPGGGLDEDRRWQAIRDTILASEPILFVLDNFEDNLDLADVPGEKGRFALKDKVLDARLADLFAARTHARFLFTSRYPFGFGAQRHLLGLEEASLPPLSEPEAWKLMYHLPALRGLGPKEKAEAYRTVGGHPRCLEYLDAHLRGGREWPAEAPALRDALLKKVPQIALAKERWDEALQTAVARAAEDILLDWLLERIEGTPARKLLDRAAVFRRQVDPFALELAAERPVNDAELDALDALTLLWREGEWCMVPQVTATALVGRLGADELRAAHARAARYWEHRARNFTYDLDDWLEARFHLLEAGQREKAHDIALAAEDVLSLRGHVRQAERLARETYGLAKADGLPEAQAEAANRLALLAAQRGEVREAIQRYEESLSLYRAAGNRRGEGNALGNLGLAYADLGDARKAIEFYQQRLPIAREIGDRCGEGAALGNLGNAYAALGDARKAIEFYQHALAIDREIGDRRGEGAALGNLGLAYAALGDAPEAIGFYQQQLAVVREIGDRRGEGTALGNLGNAYLSLGDARKAIEFYQQQLAIVREIGDRRGEGAALGNLGLAYAALGDARKAIEFYQQALAIDREIGGRQGECAALGNLGSAFLQLGDTASATRALEDGLRLALAARDPLRTIQIAWVLRHVYAQKGDKLSALALEAFAFWRFRAMGYPQARAAAGNLARLRQAMGEAPFRQALARAEETVAGLFRELAGDAGAEMARGLRLSPEDIEEPADEPAEPSLAQLPPEALEELARKAESEEAGERAEAVRWAVAQELLRRGMADRARPLLERSLDHERRGGSPRNRAVSALFLGMALAQLGEAGQARAILDEARAAAQEAADEPLLAAIQQVADPLRPS